MILNEAISMSADVTITKITTDRFSYEYGKVLHLCLKPGVDSTKLVLNIDDKDFFTTDLNFECHANLLIVRRDYKVEHDRFELILPRHSFAKIEITEHSFNMLTTVINENASRYEEEQREARKSMFLNNVNNNKN